MSFSTRRRLLVALALLATGCGVSQTGLGPLPDGSTGGASGTPVCPAGLVEQASWPAKMAATSCVRWCGPDDIGLMTCSQTSKADCQKTSGCLCLEAPCVGCEPCKFIMVPDCYAPTNAATAPQCAAGVVQGGSCSPACGRLLCLHSDGKTACICNRYGQYACAAWNGSQW